ncbi:hypothetical protein [Marinobacter aromaticivorans]|uniref:Uncharacterized protein n=1 Tax=Marinobacter aromaticivorans TaxID=1494078 RepID=A0ABW2IVD2_9GAMM|nr:hypothetical protein [Marinobacter aromaticivorans]
MQKTLDDLHSKTGLPDDFKKNINLFPSDIDTGDLGYRQTHASS